MSTLLLYVQVEADLRNHELYLESEACNGLRLWAENFDRVVVMLPLSRVRRTTGWQPVRAIGPAIGRIEFVPLPEAYRPDRFLRNFWPTYCRIRDCIRRSDFRVFAIGGLFGDWGAVAALESHRLGLPFAVWTSRVESEVVSADAREASRYRKLQAALYVPLMRALERHIIQRARLGLFQGRDCYEIYAPFNRHPRLVHNVHLAPDQHMNEAEVAAKQARCADGPLSIVYAGRMEPMKGVLDWIRMVALLQAAGVPARATWLGDGSQMVAARQLARDLGVEDMITFMGDVRDKGMVMSTLRAAHILTFCHKTPESPRILIEALIAATPIVGYASPYAADLIAKNGGGLLIEHGDMNALACAISGLASDRGRLLDLIGRAWRDAAPFTDIAVFRYRSDLIKEAFDVIPSEPPRVCRRLQLPNRMEP